MRFMVMHKMTEDMERGAPPDPAIIEAVGKLVQEGLTEKVFVSGEGLKPSSQRLKITYEKGKRTVTQGPFGDAKELLAGFGLVRVRSQEEALSWCDQFAAAIGDVTLFMGPIVEPWDLGLMPKPKNPPLRFLFLHQPADGSDDDAAHDPRHMPRAAALIEQMTNAGVLHASGGLQGTKHGARIRYSGGKPTVVDGPFAESKELIAGYAIIDVPSKAAAVEWALRFGEVVKVHEIDVRQMQA